MTPVEQIKSKLSIVDVVGSYIKLQKAGSSYKALCPFHNEKSPSFNVSPARDAFYCFGCSKGGDIFTFVEEIEGVEFIEALRTLAERAGVELKSTDRESKSERDRLLEIMEEAALFYEKHLSSHNEALAYLSDRGLTAATINKFRIGFAPNDWRLLYDHLKGRSYQDGEIERAGLIKYPDGAESSGQALRQAQEKTPRQAQGKRPYDRFRSRIMFPLCDQSGRVVAFSGRSFGEEGEGIAKYINSPETPLYDKSSYLFGYNLAKTAIRKQNFSILVEGQVDLIMSHQAGAENTVAVSGTALTERHLALLKRLSDNVVFAFDADEAGLNATTRAFMVALRSGMAVRVARIPNGKDPADYIKGNGGEKWGEVIASAKHIIEFYLETLAQRKYDQRKFRKEVEERVLPLVLAMQSKIDQAHFIIEIARRIGVPEKAVWDEVARAQSSSKFPPREESEVATQKSARVKSRRQVAEEEIVGILLWQERTKDPAFPFAETRERYEAKLKEYGLVAYAANEDEERILIVKAEHTYEEGEVLKKTVDELLDTFEMEILRERQADLWKQLSEAELGGNKEQTKECMKAYQVITPQLLALEDRRAKRSA